MSVDNPNMWQVAFTFWFALTAVMGPSLCCCTVAVAASKGDHAAPTAPKSCCQQESLPTAPADTHDSSGDQSSKCPCEKSRHVDSLASESTVESVAVPVKFFELLPGDWSNWPSIELLPKSTGYNASSSSSVTTLAGRELLSLYSLLRC